MRFVHPPHPAVRAGPRPAHTPAVPPGFSPKSGLEPDAESDLTFGLAASREADPDSALALQREPPRGWSEVPAGRRGFAGAPAPENLRPESRKLKNPHLEQPGLESPGRENHRPDPRGPETRNPEPRNPDLRDPASRLRRAPAEESFAALHRRLAHFNERRFRPGFAGEGWRGELAEELELRLLEGEMIERERAALAGRLNEVPTDADGFLAWFEALRDTGPGQGDPLFPWLAGHATLEDMRWFVAQEVAGEAGFDDLVAITQVKFPARAKLEMARNYWDEMGRGHLRGMHGPMLMDAARHLRLRPTLEDTVPEALALANVMAALATSRRYAYQSVGALGAIEMTAPGRVGQVNAGLKRLGVPATARRYFQLHAGLDVAHSLAWNREVLRPLVEADPACARPLAEGALLRLHCGARCFARYRAELMG